MLQAAFRREAAASVCYDEMKKRYAYLYAPAGESTRLYNSTTTLLIVEEMAEDVRGGGGVVQASG